MFFDFIKSDLAYLGLQTELLEMCNWDEDELESKLKLILTFFEDCNPRSYDSWNSMVVDIRASLIKHLDESFIDIIIQIVEHHRNELVEFMSLEEN